MNTVSAMGPPPTVPTMDVSSGGKAPPLPRKVKKDSGKSALEAMGMMMHNTEEEEEYTEACFVER